MNNEKKARVIEVNRNQHILRPIDVEMLVDENHSVRAIWEFVSRLDLKKFYEKIVAVEGEAGRTAWDPKLLISIWIYAYSQGIGSAREIERRCEYDPSYQWLTGMEVINHHTLSDFRINGKEILDELFQQTLGLLSADGLITMERVMHDGTKIKASASDGTFRREERVREFLKLADEQVTAMGDPKKDDISKREHKAQERVSRERKERLELALKELEKIRLVKSDKESKEQARVSITDPEARIMKHGNGGFAPGYNAQISTDSAHGIIVGAYITQNPTDASELIPALNAIKKNLGKFPDKIVADGGYTNLQNIVDTENSGVNFIGSLGDRAAPSKSLGKLKSHGIEEAFYPDKFIFNPDTDTFTCPTGKILRLNGRDKEHGSYIRFRYLAKAKDCHACPFKQHCCPNAKKGRTVMRKADHPSLATFKAKMETETAKNIYKQRSQIAEFSNAWIKSKIKLRQFCVRGMQKVSTELQWACLVLNIQHWIRLRWV